MSEKKYYVSNHGNDLAGILHRAKQNADLPTRGRPICVMVHGVFAHKDQLWHRQLVQRLADERGLDSFRFDFSGNGESPGTFRLPGYEQEVDDLRCVVDWLETEFGYHLNLLIAHSKGVMTAFEYIARHRQDLPLFINISGRFSMRDIYFTMKPILPILEEEGYYDMVMEIGTSTYGGRVTRKDIDIYASWPIEETLAGFPPTTDVLGIQGTDDTTVRWRDANVFKDILSRRSPGTIRVRFVQGATHTYLGHFDELMDHVMEFLRDTDTPERAEVRRTARRDTSGVQGALHERQRLKRAQDAKL